MTDCSFESRLHQLEEQQARMCETAHLGQAQEMLISFQIDYLTDQTNALKTAVQALAKLQTSRRQPQEKLEQRANRLAVTATQIVRERAVRRLITTNLSAMVAAWGNPMPNDPDHDDPDPDDATLIYR
jgi:hypothetical protein